MTPLTLALLFLAQSESDLDRLVAEHKGLMAQIADAPSDLVAACARRRRAADAIRAFTRGACLCGAPSHAACKSKETCDPVENSYKEQLATEYKAADSAVKALEASQSGDSKTVDLRMKRLREIAEKLGADSGIYDLSAADLTAAIERLKRSQGYWQTSRKRLAQIDRDFTDQGVRAALEEAQRARCKAWADAAVDTLSVAMKGALGETPNVNHELIAGAVETVAGSVRDLCTREPGDLKATEVLKRCLDGINILKTALAAAANESGKRLILALNTIYGTVSSLVNGGEAAWKAESWRDKCAEVTEALLSVAGAVDPVGAAGKAGWSAGKAANLTVRNWDNISEMRAALDQNAKAQDLADARIRAIDRKVQLYQHRLDHAKD